MPVTAEPITRTDRPSFRPYRARVEALTRLSEHFVRVTFGCDDFVFFAEHGLDQRLKLVFPQPNGHLDDLGVDDEGSIERGEWYELWRALPAAERSPFRTYTVRRIDAGARRLDIDFVVHGAADPHGDGSPAHAEGPATTWLRQATPGDEILIVGPDARSINSEAGIDWQPGEATEVLLAGDETAAPAIGSILESLARDHAAGRTVPRVTAIVEVPAEDDRLALDLPGDFDVTWLAREPGAESGSRLVPAVRAWAEANPATVSAASAPRPQPLAEIDVDREILWDRPLDGQDGGFYAWLAGESAAIKTLRRLLVTERGVDRKRVAFMGYWRDGQAEKQE